MVQIEWVFFNLLVLVKTLGTQQCELSKICLLILLTGVVEWYLQFAALRYLDLGS